MYTQLNIKNFETYFVLGNNPDEKLGKRRVMLNISIRFPENAVTACSNDNLSDTICYSALLEFISEKLQAAEFNLIEKACGFLYKIVSDYVKNWAAEKFSADNVNGKKFLIRVEVEKPAPPVENLQSASFVCSDW